MIIFKLPDLGEGLPDAIIREWYVKTGDMVKSDEPLVSMETAKALVDVPSPSSGKIEKLFGNPGDTIETGQPLIGFAGKHRIQKSPPAEKSKRRQPKRLRQYAPWPKNWELIWRIFLHKANTLLPRKSKKPPTKPPPTTIWNHYHLCAARW